MRERKITRRNFIRGLGVLGASVLAGSEVKAEGEVNESFPFGLYDIREGFHPSVQAELDQAAAEGKTIEISNKTFVLDRWGGVLQITDQRGVYAKTSLSVIPDEVAPGQDVYIMGVSFSRDDKGNALVTVANPNPGHNQLETYRSNDGFHWEQLR